MVCMHDYTCILYVSSDNAVLSEEAHRELAVSTRCIFLVCLCERNYVHTNKHTHTHTYTHTGKGSLVLSDSEYLAAALTADIYLDTGPLISSPLALASLVWAAVPSIAFAGERAVSRGGSSLLLGGDGGRGGVEDGRRCWGCGFVASTAAEYEVAFLWGGELMCKWVYGCDECGCSCGVGVGWTWRRACMRI